MNGFVIQCFVSVECLGLRLEFENFEMYFGEVSVFILIKQFFEWWVQLILDKEDVYKEDENLILKVEVNFYCLIILGEVFFQYCKIVVYDQIYVLILLLVCIFLSRENQMQWLVFNGCVQCDVDVNY